MKPSTVSDMAAHKLRVALDANVLIAGILLPRWPHEVMRAALTDAFVLVLPAQVFAEARIHLTHPSQVEALEYFLRNCDYEELPIPSVDVVRQHVNVIRSEKDVPIALSLLHGNVDIFVTSDRDFTEPDATLPVFREQVQVMLPAVFLRKVLGWDYEALEAIRYRTWDQAVSEGESGDEPSA